MGLLGHAAHEGEAPAGVALLLDLAADRLEVPDLVARHRTHIGAVEHDNGPARIGPRRLRSILGRHDRRSCSPVACLNPQGDGMGASAYALMVCWRGR
jgi:hypothetical protein